MDYFILGKKERKEKSNMFEFEHDLKAWFDLEKLEEAIH
jgi:hypothetical protein